MYIRRISHVCSVRGLYQAANISFLDEKVFVAYAAFLKKLKKKVHMISLFSSSNTMLNTCMWKSIAEHVTYGGMVNKCTRENVKHVYVHGCLTGVFWAMLKTCMWGNV